MVPGLVVVLEGVEFVRVEFFEGLVHEVVQLVTAVEVTTSVTWAWWCACSGNWIPYVTFSDTAV